MDLHTTQTFVINGKTYTSPDDMPPDVRAQYESMSNILADKNANGVPDIMDNLVGANGTLMQSNTIIFDGKTYANMDELPPEGRAAFEKAMGKLADDNHNGVPDVIENALKNPQTIGTTQYGSTAPRVVVQQASTNMGPIIVLSIIAIGLALVIVLLVALVIAKKGQ